MRAPQASRRHVRQLVRVGVIALLAGMFHVAAAAPATAATPVGWVDYIASTSPGYVTVSGWAKDPDFPGTSIAVHLYVGGEGFALQANQYRGDVDGGQYYGYSATVPVRATGTVSYEVYGIDLNGKGNPLLQGGSGSITISNPSPVGNFDAVGSPQHRQISVAGWAGDPNNPSATLNVEVYVGGTYDNPNAEKHAITTGVSRADVASATGFGPNAGFGSTFATDKTGQQPVYVYAINHPGSPGGNTLLGTKTVNIYVDTTPPQTAITSAPRTATTSDVISVLFTADEQDATFECRWDQEPWFVCQGGTKISLTPGNHQISVRATDKYDNTDQSPAVFLVAVSAAGTTQPPPPGEQPGRSVGARAVKKKSKLRIDLGPDSASSNYRVTIQRKVGKRWRKVERLRTRGSRDVVVVNLRRGTYRVVLPKSAQAPAITSGTVRLKR